jgi:hypothetical protein
VHLWLMYEGEFFQCVEFCYIAVYDGFCEAFASDLISTFISANRSLIA